MRFYRFERTSGGTWPSIEALPTYRPGVIICVPRSNSVKPGAVFNHDTAEWVSPIWVECADPTTTPPTDAAEAAGGADHE